jgi:hypothetical protein
MKKLLLILMVAIFGNFAAKATTPETKSDAKTSTEVKAKAGDNIYYVTGINHDNTSLYNLSTTPSDNCGMAGEAPCQISTSQTLGATVSKSDVDNENGITIDDNQLAFQ